MNPPQVYMCSSSNFFTPFHFHQEALQFLLSATRLVSSEYLWLLIFLSAILIPARASSSLAFLMMYSSCKLNKQSDNIQPRLTHFPTWKQSIVLSSSNCCFLTCIQISQEADVMVWYSHLLKNFPQFVVERVAHTKSRCL